MSVGLTKGGHDAKNKGATFQVFLFPKYSDF